MHRRAVRTGERMLVTYLCLLPLLLRSLVHAQENSIVSIPREHTYSLPNGFTSNISLPWTSSTKTSNSSVNSLLASAANASFISYSSDFTSLLGPAPQLKLAASRPTENFAFEAGLWAWDRDEVWFTSSSAQFGNQSFVSILNLKDNTLTTPQFDPPVKGVNGGYYFNKTAYFTTIGSNAGVVAIDPGTKSSKPILNSYFGLPLGFVDDITWMEHDGKAYAFFTTLGSVGALVGGGPSSLPTAVFRFDLQRGTLQPVIPQSDVQFPNGVRVNAKGTKLYVDVLFNCRPSSNPSLAMSPTLHLP